LLRDNQSEKTYSHPDRRATRHIRQEIELALAVDQDRDQNLAVLSVQDALPHSFGAQPDPERKADRPIAQDDAAVIIDHEDPTIGR
jgi:hypothetical protein